MNSQKLTLVSAVAAALALSACSSSSSVSGVPNQTALIKAENNVILPETLESKTFILSGLKNQAQSELKSYAQRRYQADKVPFPGVFELEDYTITIDDRDVYKNEGSKGSIELKPLLGGGNTISITEDARLKAGDNRYNVTRTTNGVIYQTQYSIVGGLEMKGYTVGDALTSQRGRLTTSEVSNTYKTFEMLMKGSPTQKMPSEGRAVYTGVGVDSTGIGSGGWNLTYTVDFDDKSGSGRLEADVLGGKAKVDLLKSHFGNVAEPIHTNRLDKTTITGFGISGAAVAGLEGGETPEYVPFPTLPNFSNSISNSDNAEALKAWNDAVEAERKRNQRSKMFGNGSYDLAFFGPNAEEVAGLVKLKYDQSYRGSSSVEQKSIAFGGVRDVISTATAAPSSTATPATP